MAVPQIIAVKLAAELAKCFLDYAKCVEQEKTKKLAIFSNLEIMLEQVKIQDKVFNKYLEASFSERERLYQGVEAAYEKAVEIQDHTMLQMTLQFKLNVYLKAPLEGGPSLPCFDNLNNIKLEVL